MFKKVLITSGPTIEPIDPIRYISNRSSGKTGFCIASEAINRNIEEIVFITGPTHFLPEGCRCIQIETASEMRSKVHENLKDAEVIIMAAAVSDYRPLRYRSRKIKKKAEKMLLELKKNPDILLEAGKRKQKNQILIGFAAETENIFYHARSKFKRKKLDLLVLNQISEKNPAFNMDSNQVYFMTSVNIEKLPVMSKTDIAVKLWDKIFEIGAKKIGVDQ